MCALSCTDLMALAMEVAQVSKEEADEIANGRPEDRLSESDEVVLSLYRARRLGRLRTGRFRIKHEPGAQEWSNSQAILRRAQWFLDMTTAARSRGRSPVKNLASEENRS